MLNYMYKLAALFCLAASSPLPAAAPAPAAPLYSGFEQMYDLQFDDAHQTFAAWIGQHPADPLGPASDAAACLFAEFDRLHILQSEFFTHDDDFRNRRRLSPDPNLRKTFQSALATAEGLAAGALARDPRDTSALFAQVLVLGLRSDYQGLVERRYLSSLSTARSGRLAAQKLLAVDPGFYDAWLAIGVENYLLSLKPLPVRWLLHLTGNQTDRETGLAKLRLTAEKGYYLQPFARLLLAVAALRDKDRSRARELLAGLTRQFPRNHLYAEELARLRHPD